jgi:hypothetical protein
MFLDYFEAFILKIFCGKIIWQLFRRNAGKIIEVRFMIQNKWIFRGQALGRNKSKNIQKARQIIVVDYENKVFRNQRP